MSVLVETPAPVTRGTAADGTLAAATLAAGRLADLLASELVAAPQRRRDAASLDPQRIVEQARARGAFLAAVADAVAGLSSTISLAAGRAGLSHPTVSALRAAGLPGAEELDAAFSRVRQLSARVRGEDARTQAALSGALSCTRAFLHAVEPDSSAYGPRARATARASTLSRKA